eukprot:scaffold1253_cov146-Amphora_coffeaeformis.AAC.2
MMTTDFVLFAPVLVSRNPLALVGWHPRHRRAATGIEGRTVIIGSGAYGPCIHWIAIASTNTCVRSCGTDGPRLTRWLLFAPGANYHNRAVDIAVPRVCCEYPTHGYFHPARFAAQVIVGEAVGHMEVAQSVRGTDHLYLSTVLGG